MKTYTITIPEGWGIRALSWLVFLGLVGFGLPIWYAEAQRYIAIQEARTAADVRMINASTQGCQ